MNSQMKEALNDFISSNSSAIEQAMENGNHDLSKDEPAIQDLMNYLSGPSILPLCHKDSQLMSVDEKTQLHNQADYSNPTDLHISQHPPFSSPVIQNNSSDGSQFTHMCVSSSDTSFISDTPLTLLPPDQQYHQHHDSYEQNRSFFPESSKNNINVSTDFTNVQLVNSSSFDGTGNHNTNGNQISESETQFYHNGQTLQFQHTTNSESHYHHSLEPQLTSTEGGSGQFQTSSSDFKDSSVLASSFTSAATSEIHFGSIQDPLGYGLMEVNQASQGNLDSGAGQFRAPEKMHVDEPEVNFHGESRSVSLDHYQPAPVGAGEAHMHAYSTDITQNTANSPAVITTSLSEHDFHPNLNNASVTHAADDARAEPTTSAVHTSPAFDVSPFHQPSVSSPFSGQNFQQGPAVPMSLPQEAPATDFEEQPSLCQINTVTIDSTHFISQQAGAAGFTVASSSSPSQINHNSNQSSSYQNSQFQDSPGHAHTSPIIPENFQVPDSGSSPPSLGYAQKHQLRHHNSFDSPLYQQAQDSHQPSPLGCSQYQQQNPTTDSDYCRDATYVSSPDQHSVGYQNTIASPMTSAVPYTTSGQDTGMSQQQQQQQQQGYLGNSALQLCGSSDFMGFGSHKEAALKSEITAVEQQGYLSNSASQLCSPSDFMGFSSHKEAVIKAEIPSVDQACSSQNLTNFDISGPSSQGQVLNDPRKTSSDVTMGEFSSGVSLDSFPQLDLDTVVHSFSVEASVSSVLQSSTSISSVLDPPGYGMYEYSNMSSDSSGFPETTHTTESASTQLVFTQESHSTADTSTFLPTLSSSSSVAPDQSTASQFESSGFGLSSSTHATSENYPQPMQVQDSDVIHKIPEHCTSYSYQSPAINDGIFNNAETAMDISSGLGEKADNLLSSSISFEEIHMSIVKAGDVLTKGIAETKTEDQHTFFDSSHPITGNVEPSGGFSGLYSASPGIFHTEASHITGVASYEAGSLVSNMTSSSAQSSESAPDQVGLSGEMAVYVSDSSVSAGSSLPNISGDDNLISSILNMPPPSTCSSQLILQETVTKQNISVPNFLESPGTVGGSHGESDSVILMQVSDIKVSQPQVEIPVTMIDVSSPATGAGIATPGSILNAVVISNANTTTGQDLSQISYPDIPHVLGSGLNLLQCTDSSFLNQSGIGIASHVSATAGNNLISQTISALNLNPSGMTSGSVPVTAAPSLGAFLQLAAPPTDNKTPGTLNGVINPGAGTMQAPASKSNTGGITFVVVQTSTPSPVMTNTSSPQPQINVSLEDLQKLLAQQNLSQPSPSTSQKQPYTCMSSPQTLVIQKHASHSLRQSQPRLFIRGATLPNPSRLAQPHQQLQQTREKLQLLMHQTPEQIPKGSLTHRSMENISISSTQENRQSCPNSFLLSTFSQRDQQKLQILQQSQTTDQQPKIQLQLKKSQIQPQQQQQQQQQTVNIYLQQIPKPSADQKLAPLQLIGHQPFVHAHQQAQSDQKLGQSDVLSQKGQNIIHLARMQQELQQLQKQQEKDPELEGPQLKQFHQQHLKSLEKAERPCSDNLKKDYKHLHSLLTGDTPSILGNAVSSQPKALPSVLNLPSNLQLQSGLRLSSGGSGNITTVTPIRTQSSVTQASSTPLTFLPLNSFSLQLTSSNSVQPSAPLTTQAFMKAFANSTLSKSFDGKDSKTEATTASSHFSTPQPPVTSGENAEQDTTDESTSSRQASILAQILTERKRCHTPLSVDLNSPANSNSGSASPLSSPTVFEDGNTQLTLIERSADLHIKSDTMHSLEDDDENASFDLNAFHKRPSAVEFHSARSEKSESVPMKIAKPSINVDASTVVSTALTQESTFDFGSAASSTSNFSFNFGNKDENNAEVFTFGLSSCAATTNDNLQPKDGCKHYRPSSSKPTAKAVGIRSSIPTQPVRPQSRKQKDYSLKAYYSSKLDTMELKILEQPESQHRARYQTEGSRGAIKDVSQQGFPTIKLYGYNKTTKLQVFIGDECGRVKPHGFYQACRVSGKNSTACMEQEIEGTTVIEIDMLPENDMIVKLDCIGILKLRNADVERRIGPKRARDKKRTNVRARLVMRCMVDKSDGTQHILQVVSNPIVCTQPVGQPEISRMSLTESTVHGGENLFIIGKNFKNKGTSVLFQKLDSNDENVVWQAEAEIEQEFFQPTHLICKIPPYKDQAVDRAQVTQIVVSCAGKKSDPHNFLYKPVYPVAPSVKLETPMETDITLSARPLSFVSPEALHLNRMVQQTHAMSSASSNMFQLPPGTIPAIQSATITSPVVCTSSLVVQPASLVSPAAPRVSPAAPHVKVPVMPSITTESSSLPAPSMTASSSSSSSSHQALTETDQAQQTFMINEKPDELEQKPPSSLSIGTVLPLSVGDRAQVNCIVHSNSNTNTISPLSYAISGSHPEPSLTSSSSTGRAVCSDTPSSVSTSIPSKPFFVVVDPSALQANNVGGGDIIQQLLQQILEAQNKV